MNIKNKKFLGSIMVLVMAASTAVAWEWPSTNTIKMGIYMGAAAVTGWNAGRLCALLTNKKKYIDSQKIDFEWPKTQTAITAGNIYVEENMDEVGSINIKVVKDFQKDFVARTIYTRDLIKNTAWTLLPLFIGYGIHYFWLNKQVS